MASSLPEIPPSEIRLRPEKTPPPRNYSISAPSISCVFSCFFFNDTATTEIYTLSLHDALPISIPLGLRDAVDQGRLHKGDLVLIVTVGAGYTTGGVLLRWAY